MAYSIESLLRDILTERVDAMLADAMVRVNKHSPRATKPTGRRLSKAGRLAISRAAKRRWARERSKKAKKASK
jgi:hypothetical protein